MNASSGGVWYPENSYSYNEVNSHYLPSEGVGLGGSINVRGNAIVYQGSDGKYYASVNASAITGASTVGDVRFSGTVDVMSGRKVISSYNLNRFRGPSIGQAGWQDVGNSVFSLPQSSSGNIYLRINVGYTFHFGHGSAGLILQLVVIEYKLDTILMQSLIQCIRPTNPSFMLAGKCVGLTHE